MQSRRETAVHMRRGHVDHRIEAAGNCCGVADLKSHRQITGAPAGFGHSVGVQIDTESTGSGVVVQCA